MEGAGELVERVIPTNVLTHDHVAAVGDVKASGVSGARQAAEALMRAAVQGGRNVVLMNETDIARPNLHESDMVTLSTAADDGVNRRFGGLRVMPYAIPEKCIAGYYPECNVLIRLGHYA